MYALVVPAYTSAVSAVIELIIAYGVNCMCIICGGFLSDVTLTMAYIVFVFFV